MSWKSRKTYPQRRITTRKPETAGGPAWPERGERLPGPKRGVDDVDLTTRVLGASLEDLGQKQRLAARNLANIDTPGYQAEHLHFRGLLTQYIAHGGQGPVPTPSVTFDTAAVQNDGNTVSLDAQMVSLVKTGLAYRFTAAQLRDAYQRLTFAATGAGTA